MRQPKPITGESGTPGWNIYENKRYGFTVEYPSDWFIRTSSEPSFDRVIFSNIRKPSETSEESLQNESVFVIDIQRDANPQVLDIEEWYREFSTRGFSSEPDSEVRTTVGGRPAMRMEISTIGRDLHFYTFHGTDVVDLIYKISQPKFKETYEKMLSSFKFTSPETVIDTSGWETYQNEYYGFEIKYPMEWETISVWGGVVVWNKSLTSMPPGHPPMSFISERAYTDSIYFHPYEKLEDVEEKFRGPTGEKLIDFSSDCRAERFAERASYDCFLDADFQGGGRLILFLDTAGYLFSISDRLQNTYSNAILSTFKLIHGKQFDTESN
ncbi:hypothetical protein HY416_02740 [Candidatus Kaiserbacteria bacterium]|nr:hypothetical protein [Candidatus Kaiserbacteria bacterium]